MSDVLVLQFLGFKSKEAVREYAFALRGTDGASFQYFVTISNDAFVSRRVRYQDGPDICSLRLRRELATWMDYPPLTSFSVTDAELADYKDAHTPKSKPSASHTRKDTEY